MREAGFFEAGRGVDDERGGVAEVQADLHLATHHLLQRAGADHDGAEVDMVALGGGVVGEGAAQFEAAGEATESLHLYAAGAVVLDGDLVMARRLAFGVQRNIGVLVAPFAEESAAQQGIPVGDWLIAPHRIGGVVTLDAGGDGWLQRLASAGWGAGQLNATLAVKISDPPSALAVICAQVPPVFRA